MKVSFVPRILSYAIMTGSLLSPTLSAAAEITLKISHFLPPIAPAQTQVIEPWCATLTRESAGRIDCQIYPAMQLGGTPGQLVDQVRNGVADIVWTAPGYSPGRFPAIEAMELPFVIRGALSGSEAAWSFYQAHATKEFSAYKVLAIHVDGGVAIHTSSKAVNGPQGLTDLKLRTSNRLGALTLTALGGTPVAMPPAQVTEAISKGVVDGAMAAWEVVTPTKLDEVAPFHTAPVAGQPYPSATVLAMLMNKDRYDSLPADLKAILDRHSGLALVRQFGTVWEDVAASTRAKISGSKEGTITEWSADDIAAMQQTTAPVEADWIEKANKRGLDGAALAADAHRLASQPGS